MKVNKNILTIAAVVFSVFACSDDGLKFDITPSIGFETTDATVAENNASGIRVNLYTNVPITEEGSVTIEVNGLTYGVDYTSDPAVIDNTITLPLSADVETPSFFIYPILSSVSPRYINFTITSVEGGGLQLAQPNSLNYTLAIAKDFQVIVTHAFEDCSTDPASFTEQNVTGAIQANIWGCNANGFPTTPSICGEANAFGKGTGAFNSYLILPVINASAYEAIRVKMQAYSHFTSTGDDVLKVRYSTNYSGTGNPEAGGVTWIDMVDLNAQMPAEGSRAWTEVSGEFNSSASSLYIAIQYKGSTSPSTANYRIDDFEVKAK
jgi:hypothetical protein